MRFEDYHINRSLFGVLILVYLFPQCVLGLFAFKISAIVGRKPLVVIGSFIVTVSLLLIGPSHVFKIEKNLPMMMVGEVLLGLGFGSWTVFAFPVVQEAALTNFPDR